MPPFLPSTAANNPTPIQPRDSIASGADRAGNRLKAQWENPAEIVSLLLIIAGEIVGAALEQLSGPSITPVVFSFGWPSYAVKAFVSAIGIHRLIRSPSDNSHASVVVDTKTLRATRNKSFVLNKIVDDYHYWKPKHLKDEDEHDSADQYHTQDEDVEDDEDESETVANGSGDIKAETEQSMETRDTEIHVSELKKALRQPLRVSIFNASAQRPPGRVFTHDRVWYSGIAIALLQNGIAAIPCGLNGNWAILLITGIGTILAFTTGALPQFGKEKWGSSSSKGESSTHSHDRLSSQGNNPARAVALTKGSLEDGGDAIIIQGLDAAPGFDLNRLARGESYKATPLRPRATTMPDAPNGSRAEGSGDKKQKKAKPKSPSPTAWPYTRSATGFLAACWIALLIMTFGIQYDSWYLLGVGILGLLQNAFVAGSPRTPGARGLELDFLESIKEKDAGRTMLKAEEMYQGLGRSLFAAYAGEELKDGRERERWWSWVVTRYRGGAGVGPALNGQYTSQRASEEADFLKRRQTLKQHRKRSSR